MMKNEAGVRIEEIMLIRSPEDLERFKEIYEITEEISKEY